MAISTDSLSTNNSKSYSNNIISSIKYYLGRLWSMATYFPVKLYQLIIKTEKVSKKVFDQETQTNFMTTPFRHTLTPIKRFDHLRNIPSPPIVKSSPYTPIPFSFDTISPISVIKDKSHPLFDLNSSKLPSASLCDTFIIHDTEVNTLDLLKSLFVLIKDKSVDETQLSLIETIKVYDEKGNEVDITKTPLTGYFKIEWNLRKTEEDYSFLDVSDDKGSLSTTVILEESDKEDSTTDSSNDKSSLSITEILEESDEEDIVISYIYEGNFKSNQLDQQGCFKAIYSNLNTCFLLKGQFEQGVFKSGDIYYFSDEYPQKLLKYSGNFLNSNFHGQGIVSLVEANIEQVIQKGHFENGIFVEGECYTDDGKIIRGIFDYTKNIHEVSITSFKKLFFLYQGILKEGLYEGKGLLKIKYKLLQSVYDEATTQTEFKTEIIESVFSGIFQKGKFYEGNIDIKWEDNITRTVIVKDYFIDTTTTEFPINYKNPLCAGHKIVGKFDFHSLDGKGTIFNPQGIEVYEGEIKSGSPHGEGTRTLPDGTVQKGIFKFNVFQD